MKLPKFSYRTLINNYKDYIRINLGMDEAAIELDYFEYQKLAPQSCVRDYMWSLFQRMTLKGGGASVYRGMGQFVSQYEGRNGNQYIKIALDKELEGYKSQELNGRGIKMGLSVIGHKSCSHSMRISKVYDFEKLSTISVADENCSSSCCLCCFTIGAMRDKEGGLIWL